MLKQGVQEITIFFGFCIISWNHLDFWLTGILVKAFQSPRTRDGNSFFSLFCGGKFVPKISLLVFLKKS